MPLEGRPGDTRGFVHKRIIGAIGAATGAVLSGANPLTAGLRGFAQGGSVPAVPASIPGVRMAIIPCPAGFTKDTFGNCVPIAPQAPIPGVVGALQRLVPGGATGFQEPGRVPAPGFGGALQRFLPGGETGFLFDPVLGQYGAGLEPAIRETSTRVCPRGTVLGLDGVCYVKGSIRNDQRAWPRGRRPLLTGGDMRAISIAASAGRKLDRTTKRLRKLGMMKALPSPKRSKSKALVVQESGPGGVVVT